MAEIKLCFLLLTDNEQYVKQIQDFLNVINQIIVPNGICVQMQFSPELDRHKLIRMKRSYSTYDFVIFVVDRVCTDLMEHILAEMIECRKHSKSPEILLFERKLLESEIVDRTVEETDAKIRNETEAYIVPYFHIGTIKLGVLLKIYHKCQKNGYSGSIMMRDDIIWLDEKPCLSAQEIPEVLINFRLRKLKQAKRELKNKDGDTTHEFQVLQERIYQTEQNLLLCFRMIYDLLGSWQARSVIKAYYDALCSGRPVGW